ncbi:ABC-2 type transport system ATP-binding protein [Enterococcus sp. DIV0176]|uniref:ABC transporter ATP-binding protein n=1 Tax=Enterococcus sp. DIV0176 TaxID=2774758 RepID=UPI003D2FA4E8
MNPKIEIKNINKSISKHHLLKNINFEIADGEIVMINGKNGSGKSTLLEIVAQVSNATSGEIDIPKNKYDSIGYMPDTDALYNQITGPHFMKYMASLKGKKIRKSEIVDLFKRVNLEVPDRLLIKNYSFGMKKKLSLAQALLFDPKFLILDEPTSGVDEETVFKFVNLFKELKQKKVSMIVSTHDWQLIESLADKVLLINKGKLVFYEENLLTSEESKKPIQVTVTYPQTKIELLGEYFAKNKVDLFDFDLSENRVEFTCYKKDVLKYVRQFSSELPVEIKSIKINPDILNLVV